MASAPSCPTDNAMLHIFVSFAPASSEGYFSAVWIFVKVVFNFEPRPTVTVMIATAMPAAIKPYSIAVAADSSRKNRTKWRRMTLSLLPGTSRLFALNRREQRD
jgi:hypothetical protein